VFLLEYERAFAYYRKGDWQTSIEIATPLRSHPDLEAQLFVLLGNAHDEGQRHEMAVKIYKEGLKRFPESGYLLLNLGVTYMRQREFDSAMGALERGIEVAPMFASNYYWATLLYAKSNQPLWALVYGELFMLLEPSGRRKIEIGAVLAATYLKVTKIRFASEKEMKRANVPAGPLGKPIQVAFETPLLGNAGLTVNLGASGEFSLPFTFLYQMMFPTAVLTAGPEQLDPPSIDQLYKLRLAILQLWFDGDGEKKAPNAWLDYQQRVREAGHYEAYHYWLFGEVNPVEAKSWVAQNQSTVHAFVTWWEKDGQLQLDQSNRVCGLCE